MAGRQAGMELLRCPDCERTLDHGTDGSGAAWTCPVCSAHTMGIAQLGKVAGREVTAEIWRQAAEGAASPRPCPSCARGMATVGVDPPGRPFAVEVCRRCYLVWLDEGEHERLGGGEEQVAHEATGRDRAAEIMARAEAERIARAAYSGVADAGPPQHWWQWPLGVLGLPVGERLGSVGVPVATLAIGAAMVLATVLTRADAATIAEWGLVPAEPDRHGGLTVITSFFLHGGWVHLLGNLYVLLLFGSLVESRLGSRRLVLVVAAAALTGDVFHLAWDPRPAVPVVGASGGIYGLMALGALRYPRRPFRILILAPLLGIVRWVRVPAGGLIAVFVAFDLLGALWQLSGWGSVSSLAHLGGALAGLVLWVGWRDEVTPGDAPQPGGGTRDGGG